MGKVSRKPIILQKVKLPVIGDTSEDLLCCLGRMGAIKRAHEEVSLRPSTWEEAQ